jgi:hypothetical protein
MSATADRVLPCLLTAILFLISNSRIINCKHNLQSTSSTVTTNKLQPTFRCTLIHLHHKDLQSAQFALGLWQGRVEHSIQIIHRTGRLWVGARSGARPRKAHDD